MIAMRRVHTLVKLNGKDLVPLEVASLSLLPADDGMPLCAAPARPRAAVRVLEVVGESVNSCRSSTVREREIGLGKHQKHTYPSRSQKERRKKRRSALADNRYGPC